MKIAFLGLKHSLDYFQIGGVESFVRRIALQLVRQGNEVDYVLYGNNVNREVKLENGIRLKYFKSFNDSLDCIEKEYKHVICIYLLPKDRIKFSLFRNKNSTSTIFHFVYFNWHDSLFKRKLYFAKPRLFPWNGRLFCISKRQYDNISAWSEKPVLIYPPVPENYFSKPEEKLLKDKIQITFLGRIDPNKGIKEVIEIFNNLKDNNKFTCTIVGIHISEEKESAKIHNWLKKQNAIEYIEVDRLKYTPSIETFAGTVLKEADIFIQPYQRLSSTIDTPLLLLEAMASLCAVLTKPFGNIPDIYGKSDFLINPDNFISDAISLLQKITLSDLTREHKRIYEKNKKMEFNTEAVTNKFTNAITNIDKMR